MTKLDYEKSTRQRFTSQGNRKPQYFDRRKRPAGNQKIIRPERWMQMPFGQFEGWSLPAVFFAQPKYFQYLIDRRILKQNTRDEKRLYKEIQTIMEHMSHLTPPKPFNCWLLCFNANGTFRHLVAVKNSVKSKSLWTENFAKVEAVKILDVGAVCEEFKTWDESALLGKCLTHILT